MAKRYYWLRLKEDFFEQKIIKKLRRIAGGDTYTIIYLKLQLLAMKNEGRLFFENIEDEFYKELALDLDEDEENVKVTLLFLEKNKLLEIVSDTEFFLPEVLEVIGSETASAQRVREHRANKKALQCNTTVTNGNNLVIGSNKSVNFSNEDVTPQKNIEIKRENEGYYIVTKMKQVCNVEKEKEIDKESYHDNDIYIIKNLFNSFGVDFSKTHEKHVNDLLKKNDVDFLVNHFTKQYEILKNNPAVKNIPAVFSKHLFVGTCEIDPMISEREKEWEDQKETEKNYHNISDSTIEIFTSLPKEKQVEIENKILESSEDKTMLLQFKKNASGIFYKMISKKIREILEQEKLIE